MNTCTVILITVASFVIAFIGGIFFSMSLENKPLNAKRLKRVSSGLSFAQALSMAVKPFLPGYADNVIDIVLKIAEEAVKRAEKSYKAAIEINPGADDHRRAEAQKLIIDSLAMNGISITPDVQKLIDAVIPLIVRSLPPTHCRTGSARR